MGASTSKADVPEFTYGEINAFVGAGESKQSSALERIQNCLSRGLDIDVRADDDNGCQFTCLLRACRSDNDGTLSVDKNED